jgi:hypothetical protein
MPRGTLAFPQRIRIQSAKLPSMVCPSSTPLVLGQVLRGLNDMPIFESVLLPIPSLALNGLMALFQRYCWIARWGKRVFK